MDDSTTSGDEVRGGLKRTELADDSWVTCTECEFTYPPIVERCPECYPPAIPGRQSKVEVAEAKEPLTGEQVLGIMDASGVNVYAFQHATLEGFEPEPDGHALEAVQRYVEEWRESLWMRWPPRPWLYLYGAGSVVERGEVTLGNLGNGKTHLGVALARELLAQHLLAPGQYQFITAEALLLEMEGTFRSKAEDSEFRLLKKYEALELLHVDDFGVREPSAHAIRVLDELTKRREGKATIWTSNLSLKVVAQQHESLQRIVSRIAGECGEGARYALKFEGADRRLERSKRGR